MLIYPFVFLFGLIIGSFLNVLIYRLPHQENWVSKRSYCPKCKTQIPFYRNIPLLSFLLQKGKCHECNDQINFQYPAVELVVGVISVFLWPKVINLDSIFNYFFLLSIFSSFLVHFIIDYRHKILPDEINIYLAFLFLGYGLLKFPFLYVIIGGAVGFLIPYGVAYFFYKLRGIEGLGGGDIKLFGALGLYLGPQGIMLNIFLSCLLGSFVGLFLILIKVLDKNKPLAFGPFIIVAAFFQIFFPDHITHFTKMVGLLM
jgi:prepilin signal peptidase PulO-like enzyme (type II secretory pathway)